MKTKILVALSIIISTFLQGRNGYSQFTLEATYDYAYQNLAIVALEDIGMKYMVRQRPSYPGGKLLRFYNLDHSVWNILDMNSFPGPGVDYQILYVSQYLFDLDAGVEFMYVTNSLPAYTGIYEIDGTLIQAFDSLAPLVTANFHTYQYPIYNTPNGTKLILSRNNPPLNQANVYGLQGTFTQALSPFPEEVKNFNVYPNPSNSFTIVDYELPAGVMDANLNIIDLNGNIIKSYRVDSYQKNILVNNDEVAAGTYLYTLTQNSQVLVTKKIEILK